MFIGLLSIALAAEVPRGTVTVPGEVWRALQEPEAVVDLLPAPQAARRDVVLRWDGEVLHVRATWELQSWETGWWVRPINTSGLRVDRATWGGRPAVFSPDASGTWVLGQVDGKTTLVVEGTYDGDPTRGMTLDLEPALIGTVRWEVPAGLEGRVSGGVPVDGLTYIASREIPVEVGPPMPRARDRRTLTQATVGVGLTVGDGIAEGRARVTWTVRQGRAERVAVRVAGAGADLVASGPQVSRTRRVGDRLEIDLIAPQEGVFSVDLRWSVPVPVGETGQILVPTVQPEDTVRTESSFQIARDGEIEVVPEMNGWTPVAAEDLPAWGGGLIAGAPTASYTAGAPGRGGSLSLFRFVPVSGPPVMVDVASYTVALSPEGRSLTRVQYTVRNERASHLRIEPPGGMRIVGARIQDGPVTPVAEGAAWLVPLPRSLETLDGLLSFPVELVLIGESVPWSSREERSFAFPIVDAPVAVHRSTFHLPRGWSPDGEPGEGGRVEAFTEGEGLAYGFGLGDEKDAEADQIWQEAQTAYMKNDFDKADALLDELQEIGAANENLGKLRSNLDIVQGREDNVSNAMARRVVDQAKSRSLDEYREQEDALKVAEEKLAEGDYEAAERSYQQAWEMSKKLQKLEQKESVEQIKKESVALENRNKAIGMKDARGPAATTPAPDTAEVMDWDGVVVTDDVDRLSPPPPDEPDEDEMPIDTAGAFFGLLGDVAEDAEIGVEGGEVGGIVGGALGGITSGAASGYGMGSGRGGAPDPSPEEVEEDRTVEVAQVVVASRASRSPGTRSTRAAPPPAKPVDPGRFGDMKPRSPPPPPPAPPEPTRTEYEFSDMSIEGELVKPSGALDVSLDDGFEALEVTSTRLSVVIPALGETVLYQHLLLPENARHSLVLMARAPRSTARSVR